MRRQDFMRGKAETVITSTSNIRRPDKFHYGDDPRFDPVPEGYLSDEDYPSDSAVKSPKKSRTVDEAVCSVSPYDGNDDLIKLYEGDINLAKAKELRAWLDNAIIWLDAMGELREVKAAVDLEIIETGSLKTR